MFVGRFNNIHLAALRNHLVGIHHPHFNAPQPQITQPLLIAMEVHEALNQSKLIRNVFIVHIEVVFVRQVDTKKLVGHVSFQEVTVNELLVLDTSYPSALCDSM